MKISGECANVDLDTGARGSATTTYEFNTLSFSVDMRQVLGDMYDKYEHFEIIFNGIGGWANATSWTAGGITNIANTATWTLGMSGLDWEASTYNGQLSNLVYFPNRFTLPTGGYGATNFSTNNGIMFRKPTSPFVTLNITPYLTRGGQPAIAVVTTGTASIDFNFSFSIYGLYDD